MPDDIKLLEIQPDAGQILNNVAYIMAEHLKQPQEALQYAERAANARPNDPNVLDTLGWVHFLLKNCEDAERFLRQAGQILEGPEQVFVGSRPAGPDVAAKIVPATLSVAEALQELGYRGRCSFDFILRADGAARASFGVRRTFTRLR